MRSSTTFVQVPEQIEAESVLAQGRRIDNKGTYSSPKHGRIIRLRLRGTASVAIQASPKPGYVVGDRLSAEIILTESRKVGRIRVIEGRTSTHGIRECQLRDNVFCVIERAAKPIRERA